MKIESARFNSIHTIYSIQFDDGIAVILDKKLGYMQMISTGLESYYIKKMKWPKGKNLEKRVNSSREWIEKNKSRYKKVAIS
tara:strand:- start:15 stop:260 length:246 start_codon:yes stop_codon:yes gene_type:complete